MPNTLPAPPLPLLMEALLELEAGQGGPATLVLVNAALHAGLPRERISSYLVQVVRIARELRSQLRVEAPHFAIAVAVLTPDQALAYLYETEKALDGPIGHMIAKNWRSLDAEDLAHLTEATLGAARQLRQAWQKTVAYIRWDLGAVPA
jgi:hypothetical protein